MITKCFIFFLFLMSQHSVFSQIDSLIDSRDGRKYAVVQIGEMRWFKDFLKYETEMSHCPNFNEKEDDCEVGNYYSYLELDTICPAGWHVITGKEWAAYFDVLKELKGVEIQDIEMEHRKTKLPNVEFMVMDTTEKIQLFEPFNPVNLSPLGWVQGRKVQNFGTLTIWMNKEESMDGKFHLHIGPRGYIEHTHSHNIIDKPKKRRKFMVKCVCDEDTKE